MKIKLTIIFILLLALILANHHPNSKNINTPLINKVFPKQFYGWTGKDIKVDKSVFKMLEHDELLSRVYKNPKNGHQLSLSIVMTNKRAQIHDPEVCYRYQGIELNKEEDIPIDKDSLVKHVYGMKNKNAFDIIYWYTDLDKTFSERSKFMFQIALSKFLDKPMTGFALVVIISPKTQDNKEVLKFSSEVNNFLSNLD